MILVGDLILCLGGGLTVVIWLWVYLVFACLLSSDCVWVFLVVW